MKSGQSAQQQAGDAQEVRRLVLEGTFSVEELDMATKPAPKTARPKKKRTVRKKAPKKTAAGRKSAGKTMAKKKVAVARKKSAKKTSASKKRSTKKKPATASKKAAKKTASRRPAAKKPAAEKRVEAAPIELVIDGRQSIREITALKQQLDSAFAGSSAACIDAGGVESVDTAVLQLLLAFEISMREQSRTVEWKAQSDEFCRQARLADLAGHLGSPAATEKKTVLADDGLLPVF